MPNSDIHQRLEDNRLERTDLLRRVSANRQQRSKLREELEAAEQAESQEIDALADLRSRLATVEDEDLRKEMGAALEDLGSLRASQERGRRRSKWLAWWSVKFFAGRDVRQAFRVWGKIAEDEKRLPVKESAELGGAVVRRVIRVSLVGLAVAVLPTALLIWQNVEMRAQRTLLQQQLEQQRAEARRLSGDTEIVRRAQLLATIYDCASPQPLDEEENPPSICEPAAHSRARKEAAEAFVRIEIGRGARVNLSYADLEGIGVDFGDTNLSGALFTGAKLRGALFNGADLSGAHFRHAILYRAQFRRANLSEANFSETTLGSAVFFEANLSRATFRNADLSRSIFAGANFDETDLGGADLGGAALTRRTRSGNTVKDAINLSQKQINSADGGLHTSLPKGLYHPDHWLIGWTD